MIIVLLNVSTTSVLSKCGNQSKMGTTVDTVIDVKIKLFSFSKCSF